MAEPRPRYAVDTEVPPERSRAEIETLLQRYGATAFASIWQGDRHVIAFEARGRRVKFVLPLPAADHYVRNAAGRLLSGEQAQAALAKATRSRWRALLLMVKAKLEAVETGIVSFEDEFLAHFVLPDGDTLGDRLRPRLAEIADTGRLSPLLEGPR